MWEAERRENALRLKIVFALSACAVLAVGAVLGGLFLFAIQKLSGSGSGGGHSHPSPSPAPVAPLGSAGYMCQLPAAYTSLPYATTWVVVGDEFAAGFGVDASVSWVALLRATNKVRAGNTPSVLNVAQQGGGIAQQLAAAQDSQELQQALANREGVLVFVSYGVTKLESEGSDALLYELADELALVANLSLVQGVQVLLVMRPDPVYGGVRVPPALQVCPSALEMLNYPTVQTRATHLSVYAGVREAYVDLARSAAVGLVDVDAALGRYAWPFAATRTDSAFADCTLYNSMGQSLLADMLWHCMRREVYQPPT